MAISYHMIEASLLLEQVWLVYVRQSKEAAPALQELFTAFSES